MGLFYIVEGFGYFYNVIRFHDSRAYVIQFTPYEKHGLPLRGNSHKRNSVMYRYIIPNVAELGHYIRKVRVEIKLYFHCTHIQETQ